MDALRKQTFQRELWPTIDPKDRFTIVKIKDYNRLKPRIKLILIHGLSSMQPIT